MFIPWPSGAVIVRSQMSLFVPGARSVESLTGAVHQLMLGDPRWTGTATIGARKNDDGVSFLLARLADRRNHTEIPLGEPVPAELPPGLTGTISSDAAGAGVAQLSEAAAVQPDQWLRIGARLVQVGAGLGIITGQPIRYTAGGGDLVSPPAGVTDYAATAGTLTLSIADKYAPDNAWLRVTPDAEAGGTIVPSWEATAARGASAGGSTEYAFPIPGGSRFGTAGGALTVYQDAARSQLLALTDSEGLSIVPGGINQPEAAVLPGRSVRAVLHPDETPAPSAIRDWSQEIAFRWIEAPVL